MAIAAVERHKLEPWQDPKARPYVRIDHVTKKFGDVYAVDDVSLDIYQGEFFSLLGSSGCGKSTLLRMLAGLERPTSGRIFIDGVDVTDIPPYSRPVNMMFQSYALFPHMTVAENLAFPLEVRKMDKATREEKVKRALDMVQMGAFGGRRPAQLSGGQQQRLTIARALSQEPDVLMLDEFSIAVDPVTTMRIEDVLKELKSEMTIILVTNLVQQARRLADRTAFFLEGKCVEIGDTEDLFTGNAKEQSTIDYIEGKFG